MKKFFLIILVIVLGLAIIFFVLSNKSVEIPQRESLIPLDAIKMTPENDKVLPQLHSNEYEYPVPLPYPVNTRGAEDSAFIMPDGKTLYVWFTPNNKMDVIEQSQDKVTGIYKFEKQGDGWSDAQRIWFTKPGKPHLDGCGFFQDNKALICGVREGYEGLHWLSSGLKNDNWTYAEKIEFNSDYEVGELHISKDGTELYFHSSREGGKGGLDIWRSKKVDGAWQVPEKMFSGLAGEATLDEKDNVYFTHHYYEDDKMIEADIYVSYKK